MPFRPAIELGVHKYTWRQGVWKDVPLGAAAIGVSLLLNGSIAALGLR